MPLELNGALAVFTGHAAIAEAETLLDWLRNQDSPVVDLRACPSAHMSVLQVLLAARPQVVCGATAGDWRDMLVRAGLPAAREDDLHILSEAPAAKLHKEARL